MTMLIAWLLALTVAVPAGMKSAVEAAVPLPDGGEILLFQREAVNDAWDLPRSATMEAFVERHPEWAEDARVNQPFAWKESFEWGWYYAFQQVGDQKVEHLSQAYREGRIMRDRLGGMLAWLSPPALATRALQDIADTSTMDSLAYEQRVRDFHAALRSYYYPRLFRDEVFSDASLRQRPEFRATGK